MKSKRFITVSVAIVLAVASYAISLVTQSPDDLQMTGLTIPSATSTATPTATPTRTLTPPVTPMPTDTPALTPTRTPAPISAFEGGLKLRVAQVPILMYHYVSIPPPDADKFRLDLSVTPTNFEAQMEYLAAEGYHPIRVSDLADHLLNGTSLPSKPIVLTFDDGYSDMYQNVFPILQQYGFPATFFIIVGFVDKGLPGYLTWNQVQEMANAGMEIGSHTLDHVDLGGQPRSFQSNQIVGSKAMIESRIGTGVKSFSYPSSEYDSITLDLLRSSGYLAAVTEIQGLRQSSDHMYELKRIRVRGSYSVGDLENLIKYFSSNGH